MAGRVTITGARELQAMLFGRTVTPYENWWLALCSSSPSVFMTGDEIPEPVVEGNGYARKLIPNTTDWLAPTSGYAIANVQDLVYDAALADWGDLRFWALCNAETSGDVIAFGQLQPFVSPESLDQVVIPVGALSFSFTVLFQAD